MALSAKELQSFSSRITKSASSAVALNPRVTQLREQTNQVLAQGPVMVQQPKPVVNTPIKIAQPNIVQSNASWVGGQVNQNIVQPLANVAKKIGNNITATFVKPQSTMLKQAGIDIAKPETLKLKPDQKKLAPDQLQKISEPSAMMKTQSKEESLRKAREIQVFTAKKIQDLEKVFEAKKVEPKKLPKGYKEPGILGDMADALKEGMASTIGSIGAGIEMEGRRPSANPYDVKSIAAKFLATNIGKRISDEADNILASNPEWQADPKAKLLLDNGVPNPKTVARLGVGAAPSILINIAATLATAPLGGWGGLATGYLMEGGSTYKEAKKMGVSEEKAQFYGTTVGIVNSIFEHLMPASAAMGGKAFKQGAKEVSKEAVEEVSKSFAKEALKQAKKFGINVLKNGAIEGSTEGIQEFWSNVIATNYDKNRKVWDNIIESMVGGFIGGGVAGGSTESAIGDQNIITDGEYTPQQVIGQVIANKQEATVEGKELLKTAIEAQQSGQNVLIETTKQGEVDSEVTTINQEETKLETKVEKPKVEYTEGAIKKIQTQMDELLGVDPNMKNFKMKQKIWGENFMITDQAANAGDKDAIADIEKLVALQIQLEDMRDARQVYLKNKKTKKSAKEYVEGKVKERTVKFRETKEVKQIRKLQGDELLLAIENNIDKVADISKNKLQAVDDFVELEDISKKLRKGKEKPADITAAYEILQRNGIDTGQQVGQTANEYVAQKGPKFREDTAKPLTLEEIKAQNAVAKQESAKTGQEIVEDTAEKAMGWKTGDQKREFDAAISRKDTATVNEMLKDVPEYYKTEFKTQIDEALKTDTTVNEMKVEEEITPEIQLIRQKVSKQDFEDVVSKYIPKIKDYYAEEGVYTVKDYLTKIDPEAIKLELDSDYTTHQNLRRLLGNNELANEVMIDDIVEEYFKGTLPDSISKERFSVKDKAIEDVPIIRKRRFYETMTPNNIQDAKKLYDIATERSTKQNKEKVNEARKELFLRWSTDNTLAEKIGIGKSELNKKIRTMTGANANMFKTQAYLNKNVPTQFHWTGITNSNYIAKIDITAEDVDSVVNKIDDSKSSARFSSVDGKNLRTYIMNTFLSIDTRLDYSDLNFDIKALDRALGVYNNSKTLITIDQGSLNTVAHEIGHYLDFRFAKELGFENNSLSDGGFNFDYVKERNNLSDEHIYWAKNYISFIGNLIDKGEAGYNAKNAEYLQTPTEVFARFVAKFVDWTAKQSGYYHSELNYYSDRFDVSDYHNFIKLLQQKAEIDTKYNIKPLVKGKGDTISETKFRVKDDVKKLTGKTITDAQEQELIDLNRKFFGDDKVNITLQIMANSKALGQYYQNMIDIVDGQADPKATYLHEAVHKYLDVFSTTEEYVQVLEEGSKKYKTEDFAEVEEKIAEDFITYAKTKESAKTGIKGFFTKILNRIKLYFANKSAIERLYNEIIEGKAAKKSETTTDSKPLAADAIPSNEQAQTPVGEGKKAKSKAYTRVYDMLAEETKQDVSYNKLNIEKDVKNALELITSDPKTALRVGLGLEEAPAGQTETAVSIALADKAGRDGDFALQSQLEASRSLRQTRRGQEIVSERGRFNEDSPHFFIREVMDRRLRNLGSNLMSSLEELQGKAQSAKKAAIEKIDKGVSKLKEKIKADRKKITLAQDIIDSIIC